MKFINSAQLVKYMKCFFTIILLTFYFVRANAQTATEYFKSGNVKAKLLDYREGRRSFSMQNILRAHWKDTVSRLRYKPDSSIDYLGAILDYNSAIELQPNSAEIYVNRAICYFELSDFKKSFSDFDMAIKLNPVLSEAYLNRAIAKYCQSQNEEALSDINKALDLKPDDVVNIFGRGVVKSELNDFKGALLDFDNLVKARR